MRGRITNKKPFGKEGLSCEREDSNNIPPVGTHNKQKSPSVKKGFFCERGGTRTLNKWLKRPLLCH